jgi:GNAT superfamily N-acetyltransferase
MLLSGRGAVVPPPHDGHPAVVSAPDEALAVVVRWDEVEELAGSLIAVPSTFTVLAPQEAEEVIKQLAPGRDRCGATLYALSEDRAGLDAARDPRARLLGSADRCWLDTLPSDLHEEIAAAFEYSPISATFEGGRPVAFCYAAWETEALWDVSIDTLPSWRRRGCARAAAVELIAHFLERGKRPVWGAADTNTASSALAVHLGLRPIDRLLLIFPEDDDEADGPYSAERIGGC